MGIADVDKVQNDFISTLRQKEKISCTIDVQESLKTVSGKNLLVFYIPEAKRQDKPVYLNGSIKQSFLRKGACNVKCSDVELKRLMMNLPTQSDQRTGGNPTSGLWYPASPRADR
jgi:ATP-dependent DNA helicase RecG